MIFWASGIGLFGNLLGFGLTLLLNQPPGPVLVITVGLITLSTYFIKRT
jgi:zinc transport system permease protein